MGLAQPIEVGESALWLLSGTSSFVTGAAIAVDGGHTAKSLTSATRIYFEG